MDAIDLSELAPKRRAHIVAIDQDPGPNHLDLRLCEMGFAEGMSVEVLHRAPFGGDPIAVLLGETLIAMRLDEARRVKVSLEDYPIPSANRPENKVAQ